LLRGRLIAIFSVLSLLAVLPTAAEAKPGKFGSRVLKRGSHGKDVRVLQNYLTRAGYRTTVDGEFGSGTYMTVRSWEGASALKVDGKVTRKDAKVLRKAVEATPKEAPEAKSDSEVESPSYEPEADPAATGGAGFVQTSKATLNPDGTATPPSDAPEVVQEIILAGNEIASKPYRYGGGHGNWNDSGYDCSGSVSYALHGAGYLSSALTSGGFMSWGSPGRGRWVTIYAAPGHVYMVVNGRRFDTSGRYENGTRWQPSDRSSAGYVVRHPPGL
jgi:peptidoglycan hydrolase-like protein with peptidoglycan-binding domain